MFVRMLRIITKRCSGDSGRPWHWTTVSLSSVFQNLLFPEHRLLIVFCILSTWLSSIFLLISFCWFLLGFMWFLLCGGDWTRGLTHSRFMLSHWAKTQHLVFAPVYSPCLVLEGNYQWSDFKIVIDFFIALTSNLCWSAAATMMQC